MARHLRKPVLAFAVGLIAASCLAPAASGAGVPATDASAARPAASAPLGGINAGSIGYGPGEADRTIASVRALHAKVIRVEVPWAELEPLGAGNPDSHGLAYLDRLTSDAKANHIGVIMFVDDTPCWASSAPATLLASCQPHRQSQANSWPPANPADFADFVAYLAGRYGPDLTAIEVWNEPDQINEDYFAGPNKAVRYAALLRAAYPAIKQADPAVKVLAGSLVGYDGTFLRLLYAAGIKGYYDGLAVHFYSLTLASLRTFRAVEVANGDRTPLWLDEFGWTSCYPQASIEEEQPCVTPQIQAQNVTSLYRELSATSYVAAMTLFQLQDYPGNNLFGVLTTNGARKRAFGALAKVLSSPFGAPAPVTLVLHKRGSQLIASGSGPVGDYMNMTVRVRGVLRLRAKFTLDRSNRYSIALPSSLGTRGVSVIVYQTWEGPNKGVRKHA
jgi:Cellulase (glycosyl hydrolase family 5)